LVYYEIYLLLFSTCTNTTKKFILLSDLGTADFKIEFIWLHIVPEADGEFTLSHAK